MNVFGNQLALGQFDLEDFVNRMNGLGLQIPPGIQQLLPQPQVPNAQGFPTPGFPGQGGAFPGQGTFPGQGLGLGGVGQVVQQAPLAEPQPFAPAVQTPARGPSGYAGFGSPGTVRAQPRGNAYGFYRRNPAPEGTAPSFSTAPKRAEISSGPPPNGSYGGPNQDQLAAILSQRRFQR